MKVKVRFLFFKKSSIFLIACRIVFLSLGKKYASFIREMGTVLLTKRYCPVLVAQEGSALWRNTLATALLQDQNRTIPFGLIVRCPRVSTEGHGGVKKKWLKTYRILVVYG